MLEELKAMASSIQNQLTESTNQLNILNSMIERIEKAENDKWVTTSQASELLGKSSRTIRLAAENKKIRSRRRGNRTLEVNLADCTRIFKAV